MPPLTSFFRWITCACSILRLFAQTENPTVWLLKIVQYILCVYAPNYFNIKKNSSITEGSRNVFKMALNAKDLLEYCAEEYDIFLKKFFNNSYFLNHGNLLRGIDKKSLGDREL